MAALGAHTARASWALTAPTVGLAASPSPPHLESVPKLYRLPCTSSLASSASLASRSLCFSSSRASQKGPNRSPAPEPARPTSTERQAGDRLALFLFPKSWVYVWWGYLAMLGPLLGCRPPVDFRGPYTQYQHRHGGDIGDNVETILSVGPFIHCILMPFLWTCKRQAKAQGYVQQVAHPNKSLGAASRR